MAKKKTVHQLSSNELFKLASARKQEEQQKKRSVVKIELDALQQERRELIAKQRKALTTLDRKIKKLRNNLSPKVKKSTGRANNISNTVLSILQKNKKMNTTDIQAALTQEGITANNLSQTLAYLKRQGKVASPKRSIYTPA